MNGFGFIEYEDAMDARDVVPSKSPRSGARPPVTGANRCNSLP